ncbi:Fc.00g036090.m01.CDS01 [Cosmosporella sp. VM-42]
MDDAKTNALANEEVFNEATRQLAGKKRNLLYQSPFINPVLDIAVPPSQLSTQPAAQLPFEYTKPQLCFFSKSQQTDGNPSIILHAYNHPVIPRVIGFLRGGGHPPTYTTIALTAVKLASLPRPRVSAQIHKQSIQCLKGSISGGRGATRCFASAAPTNTHKAPEAIPPELAVPPARRPWQQTEQTAQTAPTASTTPSSRFYVPAVHIPAEAAKTGPVHKIHILGDDVRSRFIAHALSGVYDSVDLLGLKNMPRSRYRNVEKAGPDRSRRTTKPIQNSALSDQPAEDKNSHIDELIVTGNGLEAVKAVESVKHRVDGNTSICLMTDGLGVLEDVREQIFKGAEAEPKLILGHMDHALVYNRNRDSAKQLKGGRTMLTELPSSHIPYFNQALSMGRSRINLFETMQEARELRVSESPYDEWLRFKLPSMIFTAAVEPVCVLLGLSYKGLAQNPSAMNMVNQLLDELIKVVGNIPEIQGSTSLRRYLHGSGIHRICYQKLLGKATAPSQLLTRLNKCQPIDINYQNGYFLRRAASLGIEIPLNKFMTQMVTAKREEALVRADAYIPMEEMKRPTGFLERVRKGSLRE